LSWRVSITMEADFCVAALEEALTKHGRPEVFNTDQGLDLPGFSGELLALAGCRSGTSLRRLPD
jgi:hypothetical protein